MSVRTMLKNTAPSGHFRTACAAALLGVSVLALPQSTTAQEVTWGPVAEGMPRTAAEENGFTAHTRHDEMWDFLTELSANTTEMYLGSYGETREGRALPYAVFGRPLVANPWEAMSLNQADGDRRPIVVLAANVHGNERTFREGLLVLARDFATPGTAANDLLDGITVVVVPQVNPDGFEASLEGQRGNAWGIDLNRDYVKLEHPEIRAYIENVIGAWRPHLYVDGHNGGSRPYHLNYQCPSHASPAVELTLLCDEQIFPAIDEMLATEGLKSWYYTGGDEEEWRVGGQQARIGRNYGGFVNSIGLLFEAPRQELEIGARAGYLGYLAVTDWAVRNADALVSTVENARDETIRMGLTGTGEVPIEVTYEPEDYTVSYEILNDDDQVVEVTGARLLKKPVVVESRARPWAYTLPRDAVDAVTLLRRHGITVLQLTAEEVLDVQAYEIAGISHESQYNHEAATIVDVGNVIEVEQTFPAGTYVVPTGQSLGRLVAHMMEPETDDNVVYWNTMDAWIPRSGGTVIGSGPWNQRERTAVPLMPIYKIMQAVPLQTELVDQVWR